MACQMVFMDVEFLTMVFLDIIGQKFAIWPNINSRCATFCCAVRLIKPGVSSLSSRRSLSGEALVFFPMSPVLPEMERN